MAFERDAEVSVRASVKTLSLVRRAIVCAAMIFTGYVWPISAAHVFGPMQAIRNIARWHMNGRVGEVPFFNMTSLALHVLTLIAIGAVAISGLRTFRAWKRSVRDARRVRADDRGLFLDGALVVAADAIERADVVTDRDEAFAVAVKTRAGKTLTVPMGTERAAHALAASLVSEHDASRVVYEGVTPPRRAETLRATLALVAVLGVLALSLWGIDDNPIGAYGGRNPGAAQTQFDFSYWIQWAATFVGPMLAGFVAMALAKTFAKRIAPGRVAIDATSIEIERTRVAYSDIETVTPEDTKVLLAMRDGRKVRLAFGADRPIVELDQFVARVRAGMAGAIVATHPSAESSGVRVALQEEELVDEVLDEPTAQLRRRS